MQKLVLPNGLTVLYQKVSGLAVSVQAMVRVGSNTEIQGERGIAHMVEHLVFEGTPRRPEGNDIARSIEKVGGEFNAYTSNHRTNYYVKVLRKHAGLAIDVISDVLQNAIMREKDFIREREVVCKEIDMFQDDPKSFQWLKLEKMLFVKNASKYPSFGLRKDLMRMTRDDVFDFYKKHYHPRNVVVAIVGELSNWRFLVRESFSSWTAGQVTRRPRVIEPKKKRNAHKTFKKQYENNYLLQGYIAAKRANKESYVLDIIQSILGKGQSGKLFHELRGKRGLVYDVAVEYGSDLDFGYFVMFASYSKKHTAKVKRIILQELESLQHCSLKELREAKTYLEGDHLLELEDTQKLADQLLYWHDMGDATLLNKYIRNIKNVTLADVKRVAKKYFAHYALVELEGKSEKEKIKKK